MVIWSFGSFAFFMIPYYLKNIKGDIYSLSIATEVAEFLASVICLFIQERMDLRRALAIFCALIALGSFGIIFIADDMSAGDSSYWNVALILLTNLGIVAAFDIAYLVNA
jgi:Flp pilus assembly protein protease CpaA